MTTRAIFAAVGAMLAAPGVAGAAPTPGDYGGGALRAYEPGGLDGGEGWMWARVGSDGRARIGGSIQGPRGCGGLEFDAYVTLTANGSFRFLRFRQYAGDRGRRVYTAVRVRGRFAGAAAEGRMSGRVRTVGRGGRVRDCGRTRSHWKLRMPVVAPTPAPPRLGGVYRGLTGQPGERPRPFMLGVTAAGQVAMTIFEYRMPCGKLAYSTNEVSPGAPIRSDGSFTAGERFTLRDRRIAERYRVVVDGGFRGGGVTGTLHVRSVVRDRRTGRLIDRCDTGPVTFSAVL